MSKQQASYELPNISVDVIPFLISGDGEINVILSERVYEPFKGEPALPGVLLTPHERLDDAAYRALESKSGIQRNAVKLLLDAGVFDNPDRDPRGATVAITKVAILKYAPLTSTPPDAENPRMNRLVPVRSIIAGKEELPFDHSNIVKQAVNLFGEKFLSSKQFTQAVLGDTFNTSLVKALLKQLTELTDSDHFYDASNLTRQLKSKGWFLPVVPQAGELKSGDTVYSKEGNPVTLAAVSSSIAMNPLTRSLSNAQSVTPAENPRYMSGDSLSTTSRQGRPSQVWKWDE